MPDLKWPAMSAAKTVLQKIGIDPASRIQEFDQDYEYTACTVEELSEYLELYTRPDTTPHEKRVLGCFLLQSLCDYIASFGTPHVEQDRIFELLHTDENIHRSEIDYWKSMDEPGPNDWPEIAVYLRNWPATGSPP